MLRSLRPASTAVRDIVATARADQRKKLEVALDLARKDRSVRYDIDPAAQAALIVSGLRGAIAVVISEPTFDWGKIREEYIRGLELSLEPPLSRKPLARKRAAAGAAQGKLFNR